MSTRIREYPKALQHYWINQLTRLFGPQVQEALERIRPSIQKLSDLFTLERPHHFEDYALSELSRIAYGLFFFPQSFVRSQFPLLEAIEYRHYPLPSKKTIRILDLGAGLGACSLGVSHLLFKRFGVNAIHIHALDHSLQSLHQMNNLVSTLKNDYPRLSIQTTQENLKTLDLTPLHDDSYDIIILGFVINEVFDEDHLERKLILLKKLKKVLSKKGLILALEPAFKQSSQALHTLEKQLLQDEDFYSWGPGLHPVMPHPFLQSTKHWAHEVRHWAPPESLCFLNRTLWRSIETLKFSYILLSPHSPDPLEPTPKHCRLTSPFSLKKSGFLCSGVATDGNLYHYDVAIRSTSKAIVKAWEKRIERGDILKMDELIPLKEAGHFRVPGLEHITLLYHPQ